MSGRGRVKWFKGAFGYIAPDSGEDLFVHQENILRDGYRFLEKGDIVEFELGRNHQGAVAINVRVVSRESSLS